MKQEKLPEQLAWAGEHASEAAIVAIADAQVQIVPDAVLAHCAACARCNEAIAAAAVLSMSTGEALAAMPHEAPAPLARLLPWRALAAAAAVALLGALPALADAPARLPGAASSFMHAAPLVARGLRHVVRSDALPAWATLVPALALIVMGFALTRALPAVASRRIES